MTKRPTKRLPYLILSLALILGTLLLAACGPSPEAENEPADPAQPAVADPDDREATARSFLQLMLDDDRELQIAVRQNVADINAGMIDPSEEQLRAMRESTALVEQLLRDKFSGLLSADCLEKRLKDGSLVQYQRLLGGARATAELLDPVFTENGDRLDYTASVRCSAAEEELPVAGSLTFDAAGHIDHFTFDTIGKLSQLLAQASTGLED